MPVVTAYRTSTLQYVHWTEQRSSQGVHGTGAIDNGSPYQSSSYVNLERTRCLSCKILEKPTPHWTWHKPTTARRLKLIQALPGRRHHFHVHTSRYQETSYQNIGGWCRYTVLNDNITTRASSKADLGRYSTLLVASKRTSSDFYGKRTIFSFDKAENTETVYMYMYVYIFQSDPRVVFSVAAWRSRLPSGDSMVHR